MTKTVANKGNVAVFLAGIENNRRKADTETLVAMIGRVTGCSPRMWGTSIIGFDSYTYKRADGSEQTFMLIGVSPRKAALTIYLMPGFTEYQHLIEKMGAVKHSKSCLYVANLANVDLAVLEQLLTDSVHVMRARYYPGGQE